MYFDIFCLHHCIDLYRYLTLSIIVHNKVIIIIIIIISLQVYVARYVICNLKIFK